MKAPIAIGGLNYNTRMPSRCISRSVFTAVACAALALSAAFAQTAKRPLNHRDYDGWKTISNPRLSADGKFLAYGVFPQEGDGEVVVRNLATGADTHFPAGVRPQPPATAPVEEGPPPEARGTIIVFSADNKYVVFSTFPSKADNDKARKDRKSADQMPKDGMVIVELATAKATTVERVRRFAMSDKAAGFLAYLREAPEAPAKPANPPAEAKDGGDQQGGRGGRGGRRAASGSARDPFGTDLVLRSLVDAAERTFSDVSDFHLTEDGKQLVYAVSAHDTARNGVFVVRPGFPGEPAALLAGKGKYLKLTFDENQTELAFLSDRDDASAKLPQWKIYRWDRQAPAASDLVSAAIAGLQPGMAISDKGNLTFSHDGSRLFFGVAKPADKPAAAATEAGESAVPAPPAAADDKAVVDVWSYKDEYLQSVQKVRAARDRDRTYPAGVPDSRAEAGATRRQPDGDRHPVGEPAVGAWAATIATTAAGGLRRALRRHLPGRRHHRRSANFW